MAEAARSTKVSYKELERIRGTQASMAEVFPNMRMLIRQITMLLCQVYNNEIIEENMTPGLGGRTRSERDRSDKRSEARMENMAQFRGDRPQKKLEARE